MAQTASSPLESIYDDRFMDDYLGTKMSSDSVIVED